MGVWCGIRIRQCSRAHPWPSAATIGDAVRIPPRAAMLAPEAADRAADGRLVVRRERLVLVRARASRDVPRRPGHWHAARRPRQGSPDPPLAAPSAPLAAPAP